MTVQLQESQQKSLAETRFEQDNEKLQEYRASYDFALRSWSPFLQEASRDLQFFLGDQFDVARVE